VIARACPDERERVRQTALKDAGAPPDEPTAGHHGDIETADSATSVRSREVEAAVHRALERAVAAQHMVDSPEFKQHLADLAARQTELARQVTARAQKQVNAALARNNAQVQAALARAQSRIAEATARAGRMEADRARREVEREARDLAHATD
jgi:hypothetical protein